jgi:O-antigen/teichoic acid export membrane protein
LQLSALCKHEPFLRQLSWAAFGQLATAIGLLAGIRLLTEYVPPAVYGNVALLLGLTSFCYSLFSTPLFQALLRFYPDARRSDEIGLLKSTIFKLAKKAMLYAIFLFTAGGLIYGFMSGTSRWLGALLAAILVVDVYKILQTGLLNAKRRQREYALWNMAETWGRPVCAVFLVISFEASASHVLIGYLTASLLILWYFRPEPEPEKTWSPERRKVLLGEICRYALPLVPSSLVCGVNSLCDRYIIGGLLGYEQVGVYAAVSGLMVRPFILACGIIEQSVRPIYFDSVAAGDGRNKAILRKWMLLATAICTAGFLTIVGLRQQVVDILLAQKYRSIVDLIPWLALGYACYAITFIYENIFYAHKKTGTVFRINIIMAFMTVIVTLAMTYKYKLLGAAVSVPLLYGMKILLLRYYARKIE